ncbi:Leucine rich repeat N-terminal domain (Partial), partial [Seminavis robusta]|eukprot:Sro2749_g336190.1 Leucine rich repeat N-terminal domain (654) ;mRNA; r:2-1964
MMRLCHGHFLLVATVLSVFCGSAVSLSFQSNNVVDERSILLELYSATGGPSWNENQGWEDATPDGTDDYCEWTGVICTGEADLDTFQRRQLEEDDGDDDYYQDDGTSPAAGTTSSSSTAARESSSSNSKDPHRVMGLDLTQNFLQGRTPASLWKLPLLQYLNVNHNDKLQVDFSSVHDAPQLSIVKAQFTATASLAGLDHASLTLNVVHLSGCPLRSSFPAELLALTNLRDLQLSGCQLEGKLDGIQKLTNLRNLNLFDNQLRGPLPNEMIQMTRLQKFSCSRNQLTGDLHVVDALVDLDELYLAENQFQGRLPSLSAMPRLSRVFLNMNQLTGPVPPQFLLGITTWEPNFAETAGWIRVDISKNQLTGILPESLDILQDLSMDFNWQDNRWVNVSEALCDNEYWNRGAVMNFACDGLACPPGTYSVIGHASNSYACRTCDAAEFYGVSTCVQENDKAALIALYSETNGNNWINNTGWKLAHDWQGLYDTGDICEWYGVTCFQPGDTDDDSAGGRVRRIDLSGNNLVGVVPEDLFTMDYLDTLELSGNPELVVPLTKMDESSELRYLDISRTATVNFDGLEMASDWFAYLIADGLTLGGTLPKQVLNLTALKLLSMSECQLIGTVPEKLANLKQLNELYLFDNHLRGSIPDAIG